MRYSPQQAAIVLREVQKAMDTDEPPDLKLWRLWLTLLFTRSSGLAQDLGRALGNRVQTGPFKGMQLIPEVMIGSFAPHLLGCYEHELHETAERAIAAGYDKILNIGCAFGYYSVGFALRMPNVSIEAFDIKETARQKCRAMAALNGVADRISIKGEFRGDDFAAYANTKTLVFVDIEAAEMELLDPEKYPALRGLDIIVEMHDLMNPAISKTLLARFQPTHECEVIHNKPILPPLQEILNMPPERYLDPFDSLIASWEVRDGNTPWGIFRAKKNR